MDLTFIDQRVVEIQWNFCSNETFDLIVVCKTGKQTDRQTDKQTEREKSIVDT